MIILLVDDDGLRIVHHLEQKFFLLSIGHLAKADYLRLEDIQPVQLQ
jgi:hypothetical protein